MRDVKGEPMRTLYLIAELDGQRIALDAAHIDSVVHVAHVTPVPLAPRHLLGLAALRSRVITVIDCRAALALDPIAAEAAVRTAVVIDVEGHQYGLVVDRVEDVREISAVPSPVRARLGAGWNRAAQGMIDDGDSSLLLLDPVRLIAGASQAEAA